MNEDLLLRGISWPLILREHLVAEWPRPLERSQCPAWSEHF